MLSATLVVWINHEKVYTPCHFHRGLGSPCGDLPCGQAEHFLASNTYPRNGMVFEARFARKDSGPCPNRARCNYIKSGAACAARKRQKTEEFRSQYAARAGIEATHEQAFRRCGLRQCRYIGQAKTHLQHVLTATAINLVRPNDWWRAMPQAKTRVSHFAALAQAA